MTAPAQSLESNRTVVELFVRGPDASAFAAHRAEQLDAVGFAAAIVRTMAPLVTIGQREFRARSAGHFRASAPHSAISICHQLFAAGRDVRQ